MLTTSALGLIAVTTVLCTAVVTALALAFLRWRRTTSVAFQVTVIVAAAVLSIVASVVAVVVEMFVSTHDLTVLCWVVGISAALSLVTAWVTTHQTVTRSVGSLVESARRIGDGDVIQPEAPGWKEFNDLDAQLAETSARLAESRAEIDKLDAARRQFFAWISHDLRTPLAGMRAMTEALADGVAPDPDAYLRTIRAKVDTLTAMVDDLFELSTLQSGTLRIERELVVLLDLVSDAVTDIRPVADERGISLVHNGVAGHLLWADPRELTRAISNLLTNGVRHAPENSEILIFAHTGDREHLVLSILDHGSGVAVEDLGRMFDVGWRANTARTTETGTVGAGLGLAIARGIVEAHDGRISAEHVPDGFQLSVTLPTRTTGDR
ncbi:sensor histidine kinase [Flexivirga sp. B27]